MDVSIIIVNYNTTALLCNAIDSVIEKTKNLSYEIIVVDNNSSDNSANIIYKKYSDNVVFLELNDNIGFGRANNEGIKIAKGNKLFFLNPDTILRNNAVKILSDYIDAHPDVGVCGGNLFDAEGNPTYSFMPVFPSILWEIDILFHNLLFKLIWGRNYWFNDRGKPKDVAHITGADMMVRKEVIFKTHAFDPDFFMYGEETEWIYRIKKLKYRIVSVPEAEIYHLEGKSFNLNRDREKMILEGRKLFYKKAYSRFYCIIANGIFYLTAISRLILFAVLNKIEKYEYWLFTLKHIT